MKNAKNLIAATMMVMTIATYANANNATYTVEEKARIVNVNNVLPVNLPVLESPAPQVVKVNVDTNKHTAEQKAAIAGIQFKK